jgi:hypothetical protein
MNQNENEDPYISIARGMESSFGAHSMYDCVFSLATIIIACVTVVNVFCTISV